MSLVSVNHTHSLLLAKGLNVLRCHDVWYAKVQTSLRLACLLVSVFAGVEQPRSCRHTKEAKEWNFSEVAAIADRTAASNINELLCCEVSIAFLTPKPRSPIMFQPLCMACKIILDSVIITHALPPPPSFPVRNFRVG